MIAELALSPFGRGRARHQFLGRGFHRIDKIEIGKVACDGGRIGDAAIGIFGRLGGHGDRALDQPRQRLGGTVVGGDDRLALAHQHAQAKIVAFRALELFKLAQAPRMADRHALDEHGIGIACPSAFGFGDQVGEQVERRSGLFHFGHSYRMRR